MASVFESVLKVVPVIGGLFKRKTYALYYWDVSTCSWNLAGEGKAPTLKKEAKKYTADGIKTTIVKPGIIPKPLDCALPQAAGLTLPFNPLVLVGIAFAGVLGYVLLRKKRKP
jgi:LPXTG-motif cell wall-anchored protein